MDSNVTKPQLTVVMPVYNALPYLKKAIESVLAQSFTDYELLIIDDGSTDGSLDVIKSFEDPRIKVVQHNSNKGLIATLNEGLGIARGEYIARMDADDIWTSKDKLQKQIEYFAHSADCVLVGTWATFIDQDGNTVGKVRHPYEDRAIRNSILIKNPFIHPSVVFRKSAALQAGGFKKEDIHVEDYGLWLRLGARGTLANIPEYLMAYRIHGESVSKQNKIEQIRNSFAIVTQFGDVYPNFDLATWKWKTKLFLSRVLRKFEYTFHNTSVVSSPESADTLPKKRSNYFIALKKNDGKVLKSLNTFVPLLPPPDRLYADPMLFKYKGVNYLFFEDYDYKKGVIACVTVSGDMSIGKPATVLELTCHLSFPHVFEDHSDIYMTPETIDYHEVGLYKAVNFPGQWKKQRALVSGSDFSDPIVFKHNEYYWLFTTVRTTELRIFFAETLDGEFKPHPINTLKIQGRNAGRIFYQNSTLMRPVMDCRKEYGHSMILKEIVTLNPLEFVEKDISTIEPDWAPGLDGTHTFNVNEDLVAYDGRRTILST